MILSFTFIIWIDKRLKDVLNNYIDVEVEKMASSIVTYSIKKVYIKNEKLLNIMRNEKNEIEKISYNTPYINQLKDEILNEIQKEFNANENGDFKRYNINQQEKNKKKMKNWREGFICEININSIRGSTLFGNIGPTIPIRLSYMGYTYADIELETKEYGINNAIVTINLVIKISNLISMPISSKIHEKTIKQPISIEIIKGEIPNYLGLGKTN